jgi:hypothetical protein
MEISAIALFDSKQVVPSLFQKEVHAAHFIKASQIRVREESALILLPTAYSLSLLAKILEGFCLSINDEKKSLPRMEYPLNYLLFAFTFYVP